MPAPELDTRMVEAIVVDELPHLGDRRLLLLHGRYPPGEKATLQVGGRRVHIVDQQSVLGIVDAWLAHRAQGGDDLLVVVHPLDDDQLGWDVRGHAVRRGTVTVDLATIVQRRFGATDLDPRVRQNRWLVEGLLDAEPTVGWRRGGPVLTLDVAVRALLAARLGFDDPPDAGTLLDWSRGPGPARFRALPAEERAGLTAWLCGTVGGVAAVLMALVADGRAADAMALGIVAAVLDEPRASAETAVAVGGLLGATRIDPAERRAFVAAVEGTLERWVSAAEDGGAPGEDARRRFLAVVDRADRLAADAGLTDALADNRFLPSAFRTRLRAVAAALTPSPDATPSRPARRPPLRRCASTGSRGCTRTGAPPRRWRFACSGGSRRRVRRPDRSPRRLPPRSPRADGSTGRSPRCGRGRAPTTRSSPRPTGRCSTRPVAAGTPTTPPSRAASRPGWPTPRPRSRAGPC